MHGNRKDFLVKSKNQRDYVDKNCKEEEQECLRLMRQLVSDVQGAPYPGDGLEVEVYAIWYEHAQRYAGQCLEFINSNFPLEQKIISKSIEKLLK